MVLVVVLTIALSVARVIVDPDAPAKSGLYFCWEALVWFIVDVIVDVCELLSC